MGAALDRWDDSYYDVVWHSAYQGARRVTCLNAADCEDVASDVTRTALTVPPNHSRAHWRVAGHNRACDYLRAQDARRAREEKANHAVAPDLAPRSDPTASQAVHDDIKDVIRRRGEKGEMFLRHCDGYSISEIAAEFGRDRRTVSSYLSEVRDILLKQFGEPPDDPAGTG